MSFTRRDFLTAGAAVAATLSPPLAWADLGPRQRRGGYGAAVSRENLVKDPRLAAAVSRYCERIVPEAELKWRALRPAPDVYDFSGADALLDFAQAEDLKMRGHTLVWYADMPEWTQAISSRAEAERALVEHIETVVSRYRGRIDYWDVVNEPIPDDVRADSDRRKTIWSQYLGQAYLPLAFRTAARVDPAARLMINEYDVEFADGVFPMKRAALRRLVFELLDAGAPLHGVGLQGHLRGAKAIDRDGLETFVGELRAHGLEVWVTELDVMDHELPGPPAERDAIVAARAHDLLAAASAPAPLNGILTWGLSDRYSWIKYMFPRKDGLPNRPLPLDSEFQRKPLMDVIDAFTRAPT